MISEKIKSTVRDVQDFPKPGILFKDITPLLVDFRVRRQIVKALAVEARKLKVDAIIGVESRGFLFGISLADELNVPVVPVRKAGKLPFTKNKIEYELEYGTAEIEIHTDA
jgi:adenine phosphoribosyltransferase